MPDGYVIFRLFHDKQVAEEMGRILDLEGIPYEITESRRYFDPSFAFNKVDPEVNFKLKPEDFSKAQQALRRYYDKQLGEVERDYYLFSFTDNELIDIIRKPDEWGSFDVELAKNILHERGIEITHDVEEQVEQQRLRELGKPEAAPVVMVIAGYITAVAGGFFGLLFGWLLSSTNKTLPNGDRVPVYREEDRRHGKRMMIIGFIVFSVFMIRALLASFLAHP